MKRIYKRGICIILSVALVMSAFQYRSSQLQQNIAEKILRFHVIANSDTKEDQQLKLKIRDRIGTYLQEKMQNAKNLNDCIAILEEEKKQIENCAKEVITQEGYSYPVEVKIANVDFPVKSYGMYTFPAGNYQALEVVIGNGSGKNWWCVMYPNMCFSNSMYEVIDENAKKQLEAVLTEEEYEEIMAEGKMHVKFRYFDEFFQKIK